MGWMSWNQFGPEVSDHLLREMADAMVASGMKTAGYQYICIDDLYGTAAVAGTGTCFRIRSASPTASSPSPIMRTRKG